VLARGATPRNPPLRSAPRGGAPPTHRPLTGPEARFIRPVRAPRRNPLRFPSAQRPLTVAEARFAGPVTITSPPSTGGGVARAGARRRTAQALPASGLIYPADRRN